MHQPFKRTLINARLLHHEKLITLETMKEWELKLEGLKDLLFRIHQSGIINLQKIDHIDGNPVIIGKYIPII